MRELRLWTMVMAVVALMAACDDEAGSGAGDAGNEEDLRERPDTTGDGSNGDGGNGADTTIDAAVDSAEDGGTDTTGQDTDGQDTSEDPIQLDMEEEPSDQPGPDNPSVGCFDHDECPDDGENNGVCCTESSVYISECGTEPGCTPGNVDACLTDEQCEARGQAVCCHDWGANFDYCAPSADTCSPFIPCETVDDCAGEGNATCCSTHPYYNVTVCMPDFYAQDPGSECP